MPATQRVGRVRPKLLRCRCPQLLVSVRDEREALAALRGGSQIIDVKEPIHGPLGMADAATIRSIVETVRRESPSTPTSAALGELREWSGSRPIPALASELDFVKLGLAGLHHSRTWRREYRQVRQRFEQQAGRTLNWVAVAYADWTLALAPPPAEVVAVACEDGNEVVLIDTYVKDERRLTDWLSVDELTHLADLIHRRGMRLALAGRLATDMLPDVACAGPDILAIRSAASRSGQRTSRIHSALVRHFRASMQRVFGA